MRRIVYQRLAPDDTGEADASVNTLILSLSKDEQSCSWFDKLTTSDA
jgi:hypothetical protein